jgi:hypothetical protein
MKKKIIGILVCMLFVGTVSLPAIAFEQEKNNNFIIVEPTQNQDKGTIYGEVKLAMHLPPEVYYYPIEDAKITTRIRASFPLILFIIRWIVGKIEIYEDYTNTNGYYEIDVDPGKYVVFCSWDGEYDTRPFPKFIEVESGESIHIEDFLFWDYP